MANSDLRYPKTTGTVPIIETEIEIVQNDSDTSVSQYRNRRAIFEKIDWDAFSLRTSHTVTSIHLGIIQPIITEN